MIQRYAMAAAVAAGLASLMFYGERVLAILVSCGWAWFCF